MPSATNILTNWQLYTSQIELVTPGSVVDARNSGISVIPAISEYSPNTWRQIDD